MAVLKKQKRDDISQDSGKINKEIDEEVSMYHEDQFEDYEGLDDDSMSSEESDDDTQSSMGHISQKKNSVLLSGRKALLQSKGKQSMVKVVERSEQSNSKEHNSEKNSADNGPVFRNRQRVLFLSSRGIDYRHRHFMKDLQALMPHAKKDSKFDEKNNLGLLNEIAELYGCNNVMYFEARRRSSSRTGQLLYMWLAKSPLHGPSIKFQVQNIHTMAELNFKGNCLRGSRPLLCFDSKFDDSGDEQAAMWRLVKQMLIHHFGTPNGHRKSKPFFDHIFQFSIVDGCVWFRNYQILPENPQLAKQIKSHKAKSEMEQADPMLELSAQEMAKQPTTSTNVKSSSKISTVNQGSNATKANVESLVEIGPRFVMRPMLILDGSFGGPVVWKRQKIDLSEQSANGKKTL